jgi:hypothetical protein
MSVVGLSLDPATKQSCLRTAFQENRPECSKSVVNTKTGARHEYSPATSSSQNPYHRTNVEPSAGIHSSARRIITARSGFTASGRLTHAAKRPPSLEVGVYA